MVVLISGKPLLKLGGKGRLVLKPSGCEKVVVVLSASEWAVVVGLKLAVVLEVLKKCSKVVLNIENELVT